MPKKTLYIIVGVILLLLLAGASFLVMNKNKSPQVGQIDNQNQQDQTQTQDDSSVQSSLKDLLASGKPRKCTYTDKLDGSDVSGVMYVANGKTRGDFNTVVDGKTVTSHMIFDNPNSFNWSDGQTTGMMFKFNPNEVLNKQTDTAQKQPFDPNKVIDYKCTGWSVDNSVFVPPDSIKFTDYSSLMTPPTGTNTTPGQGSSNFCAACENLTGDAKQECMTALKCS